jgi:hypothetical protein
LGPLQVLRRRRKIVSPLQGRPDGRASAAYLMIASLRIEAICPEKMPDFPCG